MIVISELIKELEKIKEERGDLSVYLSLKADADNYLAIQEIFTDIVTNPSAKKGEPKLDELVVLCHEKST